MKVLKWIGLIILLVLISLFIISLFLPNEVQVKKEVVIHAPVKYVFPYINNFRKWDSWDPWQAKDSNMIKEFTGPEEGPGARVSWKSKTEGNGAMVIKDVVPEKEINIAIIFEPSNDEHPIKFVFEDMGDSTRVSWEFSFSMGVNPFPRYYFALAGNKQLNEDFENGLNNLKISVEENYKKCFSGLEIKDYPEQKFVCIRSRVATANLTSFFTESYGQLHEFLTQQNLTVSGAPSAIYYSWTEAMDTFDLAAAMPVPVEAEVKLKEPYVIEQLPATKAVSIVHYGSYDKTGETWEKLMKFIEMKNFELNGPSLEVYLNDPSTLPDTSQWQTLLVQPVK